MVYFTSNTKGVKVEVNISPNLATSPVDGQSTAVNANVSPEQASVYIPTLPVTGSAKLSHTPGEFSIIVADDPTGQNVEQSPVESIISIRKVTSGDGGLAPYLEKLFKSQQTLVQQFEDIAGRPPTKSRLPL